MEDSQQKLFTKVRKVIPIAVGQRCPVCNGWRTVNHGQAQCESCKDPQSGKSLGYILVPAKEATG